MSLTNNLRASADILGLSRCARFVPGADSLAASRLEQAGAVHLFKPMNFQND